MAKVNLTKLNMNAVPDMEWINGLEGIINEYYGNKNKINYITTLWKYNSDINSFVPVFEPNSNGIGLTFSDLSNVHGISYKMAETLNELKTKEGFINVLAKKLTIDLSAPTLAASLRISVLMGFGRASNTLNFSFAL